MMRTLLSILCICCGSAAFSQELRIPFEFTSEEDNHLLREDDSMKYYVATDDSTMVVGLNEETGWYRLLNQHAKTIAEGAFVQDGDKYLQDGVWTQHYPNGKLRIRGAYMRGNPIGTWQEYYNSGTLKTVANYAILSVKGETLTGLSGTYQEYYKTGKIKTNGYYISQLSTYKDTTVVEDPVTEKKIYKLISHTVLSARKTSHWEYYSETGELDKKEDF